MSLPVPVKAGGSSDRSIINMKDDYEVKYWIQVFDISESQLAAAVKAVGSKTIDVSKYLKSKNS
jgi:hypothetical protein